MSERDMSKQINKVSLSNGTVLIDLTADTVDAEHLLVGYSAHNKAGVIINGVCSFNADTSDANANASEILSGQTAYVNGSKVTGTMPNYSGSDKVTLNIIDRDTPINVPVGYHSGSVAQIDPTEAAKLIPTNIREGITVLGITGTMSALEGVTAQVKEHVIPQWTSQTILPDEGYNYLSSIQIDSIPIDYTSNAAGGQEAIIGPIGA